MVNLHEPCPCIHFIVQEHAADLLGMVRQLGPELLHGLSILLLDVHTPGRKKTILQLYHNFVPS